MEKNKMLFHFISGTPRPLLHFFSKSRIGFRSINVIRSMGTEKLLDGVKNRADFRLCNVSGCTTELLEIRAEKPKLHVLFIPGNPGVIAFYKEFVESLYDLLDGNASITGIGHVAHTRQDWEQGKLFSLQDQIDHKMNFIAHELKNADIPIVLVAHSIGSFIALEMLKRSTEQVKCCIALYPFLALNKQSQKQFIIGKVSESSFLSITFSLLVALLGIVPLRVLRLIVANSVGKTWSASAINAACAYVLKYHVIRNVFFMAKTEFRKLSDTPDWEFIKENQDKISFLFGIDDHWGPLQMFEEISNQASRIPLMIEREGHTHAFCCTEAGSIWVAQYVATQIKNEIRQSG